MNAEDSARLDQLKAENDERTTDLQRMGFAPNPASEVNLKLASMLEAIVEHFGIKGEADLRFEEIRSDELDVLIPQAVTAIQMMQAQQEEQKHAETARVLGIRG